MNTNLNRRDWLHRTVAATLTGGALHSTRDRLWAIDYPKPAPEAAKLTAYKNGDQVLFRWNNRILCVYRAHASMKYPYFYPVAGPVTGASLTAESALPYPHHRGLWLGCDPLNGGNYWSDGPLREGQIRSVGLKLGQTSPTSAVITDRCEWIRQGAPSPLEDERKFTITVTSDRLWLIDAEFKLTAREEVTIGKAKHSLFAIRAAPDISPTYGGVLMNSEGGVGAEGTYGKPAEWCGYHGKRAGGSVVEGIAVMDHPGNPWAPCPWFTRDYGHLSPSPFNFLEQPWKLPKGDSVTLKYRVALHAGDPREAELDKVYTQWIGS